VLRVRPQPGFACEGEGARKHFRLEPPRHPLVLKAVSVGKGHLKVPGARMDDFTRTPLTERLEAEVININEFLSGFDIGGGIHYGLSTRLRRSLRCSGCASIALVQLIVIWVHPPRERPAARIEVALQQLVRN